MIAALDQIEFTLDDYDGAARAKRSTVTAEPTSLPCR